MRELPKSLRQHYGGSAGQQRNRVCVDVVSVILFILLTSNIVDS